MDTLPQRSALHESDHSKAARRIDGTTWGLLLLMTGVLLLAPGAVPEGTWLILAGVILLGASAVRLAMHLRVSAFVLALGVLALVAGASAIAGVKMPLLPLFLVVLGGSLMLRAWFARSEA